LGEIRPITSLRFVAAFVVFLFHIHIRWPLSTSASVNAVLSQGAIGMSLFFVLSGFVLTYRYYDTTDFDRYRVHRVSRIVPVYMFAALITLPWLVGALDHPTPAIGALRYALLALLDLTFMQAWFPQTFDYWNNGASWSISVEAFFYALFPLILVRLRQFKDGDLAKVCAIAWVLAVLPGATYALLPQKPSFTLFYTMPIFRLPEFIVGMIAGLCFMRGRVVLKHPTTAIVVAVVALLVYLVTWGRALPTFVFVVHNWIAVPVIAITILASAQLSSGWLYRLLCHPVPVYLGRISYSFYSVQAFVLFMLIDHHQGIVTALPSLANPLLFGTFALFALLALSMLCYHVVEEPARRFISGRYARTPRPPKQHDVSSSRDSLTSLTNPSRQRRERASDG